MLQYLRDALASQADPLTSDTSLLERYVREGDEPAFESLIQRHRQMVYSVCDRMLSNALDVEDAFQATFLVLIKKAATFPSPASLGNWLYGVAYRAALETKKEASSWQEEESRTHQALTKRENSRAVLGSVLDRELERLPRKYRSVLVLCDLEGKSRPQAAWELGMLDVGTVESRQFRARKLLAKRLTRLGEKARGTPLAETLFEDTTVACLPDTLVASTIRTATLLRSSSVTAESFPTDRVFALTAEMIRAMFLSRVRTFVFATAIVLIVVTLGIIGARFALTGKPSGPKAFQSTELRHRASFTLNSEDKRSAPEQGNVITKTQDVEACRTRCPNSA